MAGVPEVVLKRADEICAQLVESDIANKAKTIETKKLKTKKSNDFEQFTLFSSPVEMEIANELKTLDLDNMTPMKAMIYLQELQGRLKG